MPQEIQDKEQSPQDKRNIDPESFKGKVYMLVFDKILLGAIIAIAFVVYDQYKTRQEDKRSKEMQNIQIDFERLKMAREYWPQILDKKAGILSRAFSLRSAMLAKSIDQSEGAAVFFELMKDGLPSQDFQYIVKPCFPQGLAVFLDKTEEMADNFYREMKDDRKGTKQKSIDDLLNLEESKRSALGSAMLESILEMGPDSFKVLNDYKYQGQHLDALYFLLQPNNSQQAEALLRIPLTGLHVVADIGIILAGYPDTNAARNLNNILSIPPDSSDIILYKEGIIDILRHLDSIRIQNFPDLSYPLAKIITDTTLISNGTHIHDIERMEYDNLKYEATEYLKIFVSNGKTFNGAAVLFAFLKQFIADIKGCQNDSLLVPILLNYRAVNYTRDLIGMISYMKSRESIQILDSLYSLPKDKLRVLYEAGVLPSAR